MQNKTTGVCPTFSIFENAEELDERKINGLRELSFLSRELIAFFSEFSAQCDVLASAHTPMEETDVYHYLGVIDGMNRRMRDCVYYLKSQTEKLKQVG